MSDIYESHESVLSAYEWVQMEGVNPEIGNSLYLDDILIQASDEIQNLKRERDKLKEALQKVAKASHGCYSKYYEGLT